MLKKLLLVIVMFVLLAGCSSEELIVDKSSSRYLATEKKYEYQNEEFMNIDIPKGYDLKQFEGMTINFIVESNLYANILSHESEKFSEATGINLKVKVMDFDILVKKVNLDFLSKSGKYQVVYVDPYQTLNRYYNYLEVLNDYNEDYKLPSISGYTSDFFENQTEVSSYFEKKDNLYSVPFDSTTMIFYYRKDIFDKYKEQFFNDKGYDWTPGTKEFTWERYIEVSAWIDKFVPDSEVKYGSAHMAQMHNSIFCDFSNILASYGGDYFLDENINTLGTQNFKEINVRDDKFIKALDIYKKAVRVSAPESVEWNWGDTANAFKNGEIAMMSNWDENYTYVENDFQSKVNGKVAYSILPYGDVRSANLYGGSGIGINKYATEKEKEASWLFIVWATSKEMQLKVLKHPEGGSLPTRKSAYSDDMILDYINNKENEESSIPKHMNAILNAWDEKNLYLRPKTSNFYEVEQVLIKNLHEMIKEDTDSYEVSEKIYMELLKLKQKSLKTEERNEKK